MAGMTGMPYGPSAVAGGVNVEALKNSARTGGTMIAAGAASWLGHGVLMIVAMIVLIGSLGQSDLLGIIQLASFAFALYIAAIVTVLLGSFLIGLGLFVYQKGTRGFSWQHGGQTFAVTDATRGRAKIAGVLVLLYGVLGIVALVGLSALMNAGTSGDLAALQGWIQTILYSWIVASILLVVGAGLYMTFVSRLRTEISTSASIGGVGFLVYAIANMIGTLLFAGTLLAIIADPLGAALSPGLVLPAIIGLFMQLMVVPIIAAVVFGLMVLSGLRMRNLTGTPPAPQPVASYYPPPPAAPAYPPGQAYGPPPPAPEAESPSANPPP